MRGKKKLLLKELVRNQKEKYRKPCLLPYAARDEMWEKQDIHTYMMIRNSPYSP